MHIAVTGAAGRLGSAMSVALASRGHRVTSFSRSALDITDCVKVLRVMRRLQPQAIINCSAYNAVDAAEANRADAFAANAQGPAFLANAANAVGALLVHYSTDFVFDGTSLEPYSEDAPTNPLGVYGASKLAGEQEVRKAHEHYILRVESLFGGQGVNGHRSTVDLIADNLLAGSPVRAVIDRVVSPSYVIDIVRATAALIECRAPSGTYHCVNSGFTTWYDLAQEIARQLGVFGQIVPVLATDLKTVAPRPLFCALSNRKLQALGIGMPTWQTATRYHLDARRAQAGVAAAL
jgi:dTDP-4-dehydrorhamnose reductase